jgi:hypothetical protein
MRTRKNRKGGALGDWVPSFLKGPVEQVKQSTGMSTQPNTQLNPAIPTQSQDLNQVTPQDVMNSQILLEQFNQLCPTLTQDPDASLSSPENMKIGEKMLSTMSKDYTDAAFINGIVTSNFTSRGVVGMPRLTRSCTDNCLTRNKKIRESLKRLLVMSKTSNILGSLSSKDVINLSFLAGKATDGVNQASSWFSRKNTPDAGVEMSTINGNPPIQGGTRRRKRRR